jgi:hypothetical protein
VLDSVEAPTRTSAQGQQVQGRPLFPAGPEVDTCCPWDSVIRLSLHIWIGDEAAFLTPREPGIQAHKQAEVDRKVRRRIPLVPAPDRLASAHRLLEEDVEIERTFGWVAGQCSGARARLSGEDAGPA